MQVSPRAKNPIVLSYLALRKSVGIIALGLPFAVAVPWWIVAHKLESSISLYYYTGTRNLFVGSLCAIAMFQLGARGYDRKDELAGTFSAICALGVAFFPTSPDSPTAHQKVIGGIHYTFAALLFFTLAYFCLVLFEMSAADTELTPQKLQRNRVYTLSGYAILASMSLLAILKLSRIDMLPGGLGTAFVFETTSLWAFGIAWLVKGEMFLKDQVPSRRVRTVGTDATPSERRAAGLGE